MPFEFDDELFTEEDIDNIIRSMGDSVNLVNDYVAGEAPSRMPPSRIRDTVKRNLEHLELMLSKKHIKESGRNLTEITECIERGKKFLK